MTYPRISVVTPSFNDAEYLETTIQSVLNQNYPNLEYIVIDGGSTDGSADIIGKYDAKIAYWESASDKGMYHALQKGFEKTSGEIMGWINSDDMLHPGSLFVIGELYRDFPAIQWLQGLPNVIDERGRMVSAMHWPELSKLYFYTKRRNLRRYIQQESTFWRRSLWEKAGSHISTKYRYAGDFELWMRFFQHERLFHLNACLGAFRTSRSGQASVEHFSDYVTETREILKNFPLNRQDRSQLRKMEMADTLAGKVQRLLNGFKDRLGLSDPSVVRDAIYFDSSTQKFRMIE